MAACPPRVVVLDDLFALARGLEVFFGSFTSSWSLGAEGGEWEPTTALAYAPAFVAGAWCRRHLPNGQIATAVGDKCIGTAGAAVVLASCDAAVAWEAQGNGDAFRSVYSQFRVLRGAHGQCKAN